MAATSYDGLLNIGEHCAYSGCHQLDFLPFRCPNCESKFCSDHKTPDSHQCTAPVKTKSTPVLSAPNRASQRLGAVERPKNCFAKDCTIVINTTLSPATQCPTCKNVTCLKHRLNHACPGPRKADSTAPKTAMAKLAEWKAKQQAKISIPITTEKESTSVLPSLFKSKAKISSSAAIVARAKDVAALKNNAKGDSSIAQGNRIYVFVETDVARSPSPLSTSSASSKTKNTKVEMFFGKDYPVGKVLDKASQRLQISNHNNSMNQDKDRLRIYHVESRRVLEFGEKLGMAKVKDGDTLVVVKGLIMPNLLH
ncbi:hypothetical protein V1512DRAFT_264131 [Lipomyces arxii]|uniref:uncharacterized protein n=1 Tax=Lipomyces arxii TaxID=56418 RepID=UPI0034CFFE51